MRCLPGQRSAISGRGARARGGIGTAAARDLIATGRRLADQPDLAAAAKEGSLSREKVALVGGAAAVNPTAADRLLELAATSSLAALREECGRVKAAVGDPEQRRRAIHARRSLRTWTDVEGVWHLAAAGNPEDGAQLMAALAPRSEARFRAARAAAEHEQPAAYAFDALVELGREAARLDGVEDSTVEARSQPGGPAPEKGIHADGRPKGRRRRRGAPVKLLVRIDYDTWLRGAPREGETCELVGYGPIAVSAVRELLDAGDPFVAAILTKGKELVGVAHLGRRATAIQQSALQWLYPTCAVRGCTAEARLETDHRLDWAATHYTAFELLDRLCHQHHAMKTRENWALVAGTGKREFVHPSDPRHPRHAAAACA